MNHRVLLLALGLGLAGFGSPIARADFTIGDYYGTNFGSNTVVHFSKGGAVLGSFIVPTPSVYDTVRGLAFNPGDGLLYVASAYSTGDITVRAFNSAGAVQQTYFMASQGGGNAAYDKVAFDNSGHFFVNDGAGIHQFTVGSPNSGVLIPNTNTYGGVQDVKVLPNGDLLVANRYNVFEITTGGSFVRGLSPSTGFFSLTDIQGVAYDAASDSVYLTMLGMSGSSFQIEKFNFSTGALLASTQFIYGSTIALTTEGNLLVGSSSQAPALFAPNLNRIVQFAGESRMFVAQAAVPEPASLAMLGLGLGSALIVARRRAARA